MVLTEGPRGATKRQGRESLPRNASDDEILGIMSSSAAGTPESPQLALDFDKANGDDGRDADSEADGSQGREGRGEGDSERLQSVLEENPELRRAWDDASAYREMFATPEDAKAATGLLTELNQIDALFFSKRTEDHATLARHIAQMDPAAFASLAREIQRVAGTGGTASWGASQIESRGALQNGENRQQSPQMDAAAAQENHGEERANQLASQSAQVTPEQADFLRATNAAAVQGVIDAVENQVEKLLPESTPKGARNRIVGEIYRELDRALQANQQLGLQMRQALRSGGLDAGHLRAIVSLITARAKQALPSLAKRVLNEWTSTVIAAQQDRQSRQRAAERRVDIAGARGGSNERKRLSPRQVDYSRMSDSDILNL